MDAFNGFLAQPLTHQSTLIKKDLIKSMSLPLTATGNVTFIYIYEVPCDISVEMSLCEMMAPQKIVELTCNYRLTLLYGGYGYV